MARKRVVVCDNCGKQVDNEDEGGLPAGWIVVHVAGDEVEEREWIFGSRMVRDLRELTLCSKPCVNSWAMLAEEVAS